MNLRVIVIAVATAYEVCIEPIPIGIGQVRTVTVLIDPIIGYLDGAREDGGIRVVAVIIIKPIAVEIDSASAPLIGRTELPPTLLIQVPVKQTSTREEEQQRREHRVGGAGHA
jgi:hypothetical protein